jgi:hypothetical protein
MQAAPNNRCERAAQTRFDIRFYAAWRRVDSIGIPCFFDRALLRFVKAATSGEIGLSAGAEGATAPETLRQKDRVARMTSGKRRLGLRVIGRPPKG